MLPAGRSWSCNAGSCATRRVNSRTPPRGRTSRCTRAMTCRTTSASDASGSDAGLSTVRNSWSAAPSSTARARQVAHDAICTDKATCSCAASAPSSPQLMCSIICSHTSPVGVSPRSIPFPLCRPAGKNALWKNAFQVRYSWPAHSAWHPLWLVFHVHVSASHPESAQSIGQLQTRPANSAFECADGQLQQVCGFLVTHPLAGDQNQRVAHVRRQCRDGTFHRQQQLIAFVDLSRVVAGDAALPFDLLFNIEVQVPFGWATADMIFEQIEGNACEPGREPRLGMKTRESAKGLQESFLHQILRIMGVVFVFENEAHDTLLMTPYQQTELFSVAAQNGHNQ